jgi:alpha-tubulin suppressor-like RCC1 family protein
LNGHVWGFGFNGHGELGLCDTYRRTFPCQIPRLDDIQSISSGFYHNLVVDKAGTLFGFGNNSHGQLGLTELEDQLSPARVDVLKSISRVYCGGLFSVVVEIRGTVWVFGNNLLAQMGLGDNHNRMNPIVHSRLTSIDPLEIIVGGESMFCVTRNGAVFSCGNNEYGQLAQGDTKRRYKLSEIPEFVGRRRISPVKSAASYLRQFTAPDVK